MINAMNINMLLNALSFYPITTLAIVGLFGLCIGSFLNVVIYRLPRMLLRDWHKQATAFLRTCPILPDIYNPNFRFTDLSDNQAEITEEAEKTFNLAGPRSHCQHCQHQLPWWCNIPLISFLLLCGRCHFCHKTIAWRYPLLELLSTILPVIVLMNLGINVAGFSGVVLTWFLLVMTFIDLDHQLLPDNLTLPLLWLGLLLNLFNVFVPINSAVIAAIGGYASLWLIGQLFYRLTGREGMGYGDFKFIAALGAWFGWHMLIVIVLLGSVIGALVGIGIHLIHRHKKSIPLPFGPHLAIAAWLCLCWGWVLQAILEQPIFN